MATLECFCIGGMKLWFWSHDHRPPHFHAKRCGEWEVRVNFLESPGQMFDFIWIAKKARMSRQDRKLLEEMVERHRMLLLSEWERKVVPDENLN